MRTENGKRLTPNCSLTFQVNVDLKVSIEAISQTEINLLGFFLFLNLFFFVCYCLVCNKEDKFAKSKLGSSRNK